MAFEHHVLLWLLGLPLVAAVVVAALGPRRGDLVRWVSLAASLAVLALAVVLAWRFVHIGGLVDQHCPCVVRPRPGHRQLPLVKQRPKILPVRRPRRVATRPAGSRTRSTRSSGAARAA